MSDQLFDRQGNEYTGKVKLTNTGRPFYNSKRPCGRCFGKGDSGWHPSGIAGGVCFKCGGQCYFPTTVKLYTTEQLKKMNIAKAKRDAKKEAARIAKQKAADTRIAKERDAAMELAKPLLDRMVALEIDLTGPGFLADIYSKVTTKSAMLSERQIEAVTNTLNKIENERDRKLNSVFLGSVKERITLELEFVRMIELEDYGYGIQFIMITKDVTTGSTVVYKGGYNGLHFPIDEDGFIVRGSKTTVTVTVKEHKEYNGEKQTVVNRPRKVKEIE